MKAILTFPALTVVFAISGCMTGMGTGTDMASAMVGVQGVTQGAQAPRAEDMALSCGQIQSRVNNLYARYQELETEQRARQRKSAMLDGLVDMGTSLIGVSGMANAGGSVSAIRNVSMATNYGGAALSSLASQESSTQQLKDVTDATLLAQRISQLERAKFEKGCVS